MNFPTTVFAYLACIFIFTSCKFQIGPAYPERDGRAYLEKKGYSENIIASVLSLSELDNSTFEKLSREHSADVRFLIAQNPFISPSLLSLLASDNSDFVRGGAALNPNLTIEQIVRLSSDPSHTTRLYIARNPNIPEEYLLRLHSEQNMDLIWFAMNPNCPESLKQKMREQNDKKALHWLDIINKK